MERKILRYLYDNFYLKGDFFNYHSLQPVFDKLNTGTDIKAFHDNIKPVIHNLVNNGLIQLEADHMGDWDNPKDGTVLWDYKNQPINVRITGNKGVDFIEKIISAEEQSSLTDSVKSTNITVKITSILTAIFIFATVLIAFFQYKKNEEVKVINEINLKGLEKVLQSEQELQQTQLKLMLYLKGQDSSKKKHGY